MSVRGEKEQHYMLIHEGSAFYNMTRSNVHRNSPLSSNTKDLKCEMPAANSVSRLSSKLLENVR